MKPVYRRSHVLFLALSAIALAACLQSPTGGARCGSARRAGSGVTVKPLDWLKAQTPPDFAPNSTLPPLTRWGWAMSFDVAKELADRWGYAVEFAGYVSEKVADEALANPNGRNGQCLALVAGNPRKYKLGVLLDRQFPKDMPPEAYLRDAQGNFISDKGNPKSLESGDAGGLLEAGRTTQRRGAGQAPCPLPDRHHPERRRVRAERPGLGPEVLGEGPQGGRRQGRAELVRVYLPPEGPRAEGRCRCRPRRDPRPPALRLLHLRRRHAPARHAQDLPRRLGVGLR